MHSAPAFLRETFALNVDLKAQAFALLPWGGVPLELPQPGSHQFTRFRIYPALVGWEPKAPQSKNKFSYVFKNVHI